MVTQWLHLEELGSDPWVLPVWASAKSATDAGRFAPLPPELHSVGLHISIKLNIIARVIARVNEGTNELYAAARAHEPEHVFSRGRQGYALCVDDDLKYRLISDIDAFLFEVNSCAELMENLTRRLFAHTGRPASPCDVRREIQAAHARKGLDLRWFALLDKNRNFIAHEGACYIAIDISDGGRWDLLIMRDNLIEFDDSSRFFTLSDLSAVAHGFVNAKGVLQELLVGLFQ